MSMSMFTSVELLRNRQQPLTIRLIEFINGPNPYGTSLRPLCAASHSEQNRREVSHA